MKAPGFATLWLAGPLLLAACLASAAPPPAATQPDAQPELLPPLAAPIPAPPLLVGPADAAPVSGQMEGHASSWPPGPDEAGPSSPTVAAPAAGPAAAAQAGVNLTISAKPAVPSAAVPGATTAPDAAGAGVLTVEMDRFGRLTVAGRPVWPGSLTALLADHRAAGPDARVELVIAADAVPADAAALADRCRAAGFAPGRVARRPATTQPAGSAFGAPNRDASRLGGPFPANDPRAAIDLLTGHWREHRRTVADNVAAQQAWFEQLDGRRRLLDRQYRELSDYLARALREYRDALTRLRAKE